MSIKSIIMSLTCAGEDQVGALIESFGDAVIDAWTKVTGNTRCYCATVWDVMRYVDGADHDWVEEVVQDLNLRLRVWAGVR